MIQECRHSKISPRVKFDQQRQQRSAASARWLALDRVWDSGLTDVTASRSARLTKHRAFIGVSAAQASSLSRLQGECASIRCTGQKHWSDQEGTEENLVQAIDRGAIVDEVGCLSRSIAQFLVLT